MIDNTENKCPCCGHVPPPADLGWESTLRLRVISDETEKYFSGKIPSGGLFPAITDVSFVYHERPTFKMERAYQRTWAEVEWRREPW